MEWVNLFEQHILNRGIEYYEDDCVSDLEILDNEICAEVEGSEIYHVSVIMKNEKVLEMECDCPYAAKGYNCKHMAAVLFKYEEYFSENENEEVYAVNSDKMDSKSSVSIKLQEIETLVNKIPEADIRKLVVGFLRENESLKNRLQLKYDFKMNAHQMTELKREVKSIVYRYSDRRGFVDWHNAFDFCSALSCFLDEKIPFLIEHGCFLQAFEITNLVFFEVGNTDMDDSDGGTGMICEKCYDYWTEIVAKCNQNDKKIIEEWFQSHRETDYVIDYMMEYIDEFYDQYFISEDEIREQMEALDQITEERKNQNDCGRVYSIRYGYRDVILQRLDYMKRLLMPEEEIQKYRLLHRHFFSIRELEIKEALEMENKELAVKILEESKDMDKEYPEKIKQYSCQLIDLYRELNKEQEYKKELIFQLVKCPQSDLTNFNLLKAIIHSVEEWDELIGQILSVNKNIYFACDVLYQEKRYEDLMQLIERENRVSLLDKYEKTLRKTYPERVIRVYTNYIVLEMERVADRKHYKYLVQYLKKIAKCENGKKEADKIVGKWQMEYKRRSALMDELRKAGF